VSGAVIAALRDYQRFVGFPVKNLLESNSCTEAQVAPGLEAFSGEPKIISVLNEEPVPAADKPGVLRVRAEQGWFFGASASVQSGLARQEQGWHGRVMAGLRGGYGAAGLVNDPLNAQVFVDVAAVGERLYDGTGTSVTGFAVRLRAPGLVVMDGLLAVPLAAALKDQCPACIKWGAAAAGGGPWRTFRSHQLLGRWSWQVSLGRDATLTIFRNQPNAGKHRYELLLPALTSRYYWPMSNGSAWSQSADIYVDLGPSLTFGSAHEGKKPAIGAFISISAAPRVFP
jgi:hypothetical protein